MSVQVKLSEKQCLFCEKTDTVIVKAKDFQGAVCKDHLRPLLKKWEPKPEPVQS